MSDFDLWLREAYASTWVDWSPEALMLGRAAFDSQAAQLIDTQRNEERADAEIGELTMKLHTLEAAVRAVRDEHADNQFELAELYALVPEGSEGGS